MKVHRSDINIVDILMTLRDMIREEIDMKLEEHKLILPRVDQEGYEKIFNRNGCDEPEPWEST